jgi:hypothetical protein
MNEMMIGGGQLPKLNNKVGSNEPSKRFFFILNESE